MASIEKTTTELVSAITGKDMLAGWQVLVAYKQDALNSLLAARHAEIQKTTCIQKVTPFQASAANPFSPGSSLQGYFSLELGTPTLSFKSIEDVPSIELLYSLTGKTGLTLDQLTNDLGSDHFLLVEASLKAVTGKLDSSSSTAISSNKIVTFESGKTTEAHIVIDLSKPVCSVVNAKGEPDAVFDTTLAGILKTHIAKVGLQYCLASISAEIGKDSGKSQLVPREFCFTTVRNSGDPSALLIWISVGNDAKAYPNGRSGTDVNYPLLFRPDDRGSQILPIPKDKNAVVYIANSVVYGLFFKAVLERIGYTNVNRKTNPNQNAVMSITATPPQKSVSMAEWNPDGKGNDKQGSRHCDGFTFDMNSVDMVLDVSQTGGKLKLEKSVSPVKFSMVNWDYDVTGTSGNYRDDKHADATFKLSVDVDGKWVGNGEKEEVGLAFTLPTKFTTAITANQHPGWWDEHMNNVYNGKLDGMDQLSVDMPQISFNLGAIDYFLETNLLFPGKHVYKSGDVSSNLFFPQDLMILGTLVDK